MLATVMFSDIVGSTGARRGSATAAWRDLLVAHDAVVRRELDRFGGREVKTIGDAFLARSTACRRGRSAAPGRSSTALEPLGLDGAHRPAHRRVRGDRRRRRRDGGAHRRARHGAADAGEVLGVRHRLGTSSSAPGCDFKDRGTHQPRGVPGEWPLFAVRG